MPSSLTPHSTVTATVPGSISPMNSTAAAADHVLVAADPVLGEEGVAPLLEVGEDDRVIDVPEAVEVLPAGLDRMAAFAHAKASRSAGVRL